MKRTVSSMLVLVCISAAVSCKKETITTTESSAEMSAVAASDAQSAKTVITGFGVMVADPNLETSQKIDVTNKLGLTYVRNTVILTGYTGKSSALDDYQNAGKKVLLNVNNKASNTGINAFPKDMKQYKKSLETVLDQYQPEVVIVENEPYNDGYYTGPITDYFTELQTAVDVCKARGLKVADGGLNIAMVFICVYQDYVFRGMQAAADDFAKRCMTDPYIKAAQGNGSDVINAKLDKCKQMIAAYKTMSLDFVNVHWYEPFSGKSASYSAPGVATEVAAYLRKATGKNVLTNEFGQTTTTPTMVSTQVSEFRAAGFSYAIDYSGTGNGGVEPKPLQKGTTLQPNGISYRNQVAVGN